MTRRTGRPPGRPAHVPTAADVAAAPTPDAARMLAWRLRHGATRAQAAARLGVDHVVIDRIEAGRRADRPAPPGISGPMARLMDLLDREAGEGAAGVAVRGTHGRHA